MDVLELSYKHLSDYMKPCFLYFGAFLEVREILTWKLISLWIAEGFLQKAEYRSLEEVAEAYMKDLINRSLVMVAKKGSLSGVKTCSIHDLLLEFCVAKAKEEYFLQVLHGPEELFTFNEPGNFNRLCIHSKVKDFQMSRLFCPRISCLLFFAHPRCAIFLSFFEFANFLEC
ncbi:hypothetical protein ACH5RR_016284 [Cinchona calisaya]|uniref:Disease resistance protein winged helix domain-containing protein n=1 Tax=Cinchona calisaya TaxID=153742 RepID=A0ABD2ZYM5_9GENT